MKRLSLISNHLSDSLILCELLPEKVAIITLNRPSKLNSLSLELWSELNRTLLSLEANPQVHVIVLTGAGPNFCVGADVTSFRNVTTGQNSLKNPIEEWFEILPRLKKPIIAAVHGMALGGGCEVAMMCDIIVADKTARFGQPEIKLALIPGAGGTQRLSKTIGKYKSMDMILTGDTITAAEAKCLGLISRISEGMCKEDAVEIAKKIAKMSLPALCLCKKAVNASFETTLTAGLNTELQLFNQALVLRDKEEGINALLGKRPPKFINS